MHINDSALQVIYADTSAPVPWDACVMTMGDFDGFHLGHNRLIEKTKHKAHELSLPAVLLTFYPSPKQALGILQEHDSIFTQDEKIKIAAHFKLDAIVFLPFDDTMQKLLPVDFISQWLVNYVKPRYIVVGFDHAFGFKRQGTPALLQEYAQNFFYQVETVEEEKFLGQKISSSRIRKFIRRGDIEKVNQLLGYAFLFSGRVIAGKARGKMLGFPTANLQIEREKILPAVGVYFCMAQIEKKFYRCVVNVGNNPTFANSEISLEAHILEWQKDIYGQELHLFFLHRLRDEKKFLCVQELQAQIAEDIETSKTIAVNKNYLFEEQLKTVEKIFRC